MGQGRACEALRCCFWNPISYHHTEVHSGVKMAPECLFLDGLGFHRTRRLGLCDFAVRLWVVEMRLVSIAGTFRFCYAAKSTAQSILRRVQLGESVAITQRL